jgi:hypothetical protein
MNFYDKKQYLDQFFPVIKESREYFGRQIKNKHPGGFVYIF